MTLPIFFIYFLFGQKRPKMPKEGSILIRAYRKAGYLTMVVAGYIPANSQLDAAIATIVKSLSIGK